MVIVIWRKKKQSSNGFGFESFFQAMKNVKANAVPDAGLPDFSAVDSVDTKQDVPRVEDVIGTALV